MQAFLQSSAGLLHYAVSIALALDRWLVSPLECVHIKDGICLTTVSVNWLYNNASMSTQ